MSETINLTDELRIRRVDRMNMTVEKLVTDDKGVSRWRQANGNGQGPFCADESGACLWVLRHGLMDEGGETDLQGAVDQYAKVAKKLERAVKAAVACR